MWKRLGVVLLSLIATFSVVYAVNKEIVATGSSFSSSGNLIIGDIILLGGKKMRYTYTNPYVAPSNPPVYGLVSYEVDNVTPDLYNAISAVPLTTAQSEFNGKLSAFEKEAINKVGDKYLYLPDYKKFSDTDITTVNDYSVGKENGINDYKDLVFDGKGPWFFSNSSTLNNQSGLAKRQLCFISPSTSNGATSPGTYFPCDTDVYKGYIRTSTEVYENNVIYALPSAISDHVGNVIPYTKSPTDTLVLGILTNRPANFDVIVNSVEYRDNGVTINGQPSRIDYSKSPNSVKPYLNFTLQNAEQARIIVKQKGTDAIAYTGTITSSSELDFDNIPLGKYDMWIMGESKASVQGSDSKEVSMPKHMELDVRDSLIKYTEISNKYVYNQNVKITDAVGNVAINYTDEPFILKTVANPDAQQIHSNDYQNFSLASPTSASTSLLVDAGGPSIVNGSLKVGTYEFRIQMYDAMGDVLQTGFIDYIDVKIIVEKATPTISFSTPTQQDMIIGDSPYIGDVTYDNTDILTASDITYTVTGGISNVLTVDPNTSDLKKYDASVVSTHTGTGLPTTYTVSATIAETANYKSATTTVNKPIYVYKGLSSLTWTPSKGSFSTSDVTSGSTVGTLLAQDGVSPFTYALVQNGDNGFSATDAANNSSFSITGGSSVNAGTSVNVVTTSTLAAGTYKMQFKVTDAKGKVSLVSASITVNSQGQAALEFKDKSNVTITTTGIKIKFDDKSTSLLAAGGSTTNPIEYYLANQADQPGQIDATQYLTVNKTNGLLTPKKVGIVKVYAKRPGNLAYGDVVTGFMNVEIEPAPQKIAFNSTTNPSKVEIVKAITEDAKGTLISSNGTGVGGIIYKSSDTTKATVDSAGVVTGVASGSVTIIATLNDSSSSTYDANYETVSCTKTVNVYTGMSLTWSDVSPLIKADENAIGDKAGTITAKDNASVPTFAISTNTTGTANADSSFFNVVGSGTTAELKLAKAISASDYASHGGTFKVQVDATDSNDTVTIDLTIQIDEADNDIYFTESGTKVTSLSKKYGENSNSFNLTVSSSNGGNVTYSVDPSDTTGTLSVTGTGGITFNKVGTGVVKAVVASGGGFSGGTITMAVTITPGDQSIAFKDKAIIKRQFAAGTKFNEVAELKETSKNIAASRAVTYASNSPSICTIDSNGEVTMLTKGTCDISASNSDSDWSATTTNKQIILYDKMSVIYTANTPNLKAETNAIGNKVGTITVSDHQSKPTYKISTNSVTQNADASFFQVIDNGATADLQLAKKITALDWVSHSGVFKVQVEVSDVNGTETIDIVVNIDQADNIVSFTENGTNITSLTKQFGENGNTFNLTSTSSNAGAVVYGVDASDTSGTISVSTAGVVTINKVGTGKVEAVIASGGGYAGKTITMNVTISKGSQSIAFKDTGNLNRAYVLNDTFSEQALLKETSTNKASSRTITYASNTTSICTIDSAGTVTMVATGTCEITASNSDANWTSETTTKRINLYSGMGVSFSQSNTPQAGESTAQAGSPVGSLTVNGGQGNKTYGVSTLSDPKNKDATFFTINTSGIISLKKAINASDIASYYDSVKNAYIMHVQFETTDTLGNKVTTDTEVEIKGAKLNAQFDTGGVGKISKVYSPNGTFTLSLSSNAGNGTPTYQLKNDPSMPSDVLQSVAGNGLVTIDNANDTNFVGNPVMVEAVIPPSNGYDGETIEVEVEITKAPQPGFGFTNTNIQMQTSSSLTPVIKGQLSTGTISLTSNDQSLVAINGNDLVTNTTEGTTTVTVIDPGDRNYQNAMGTASVTVSNKPAYNFVISVPPATYGDTGIKATILLNGGGANKVQTWTSSDPTIADIDQAGNITIYKAGSVDITCTQTTTGEPSATHTVTMVIKPKPITITINDKNKYVGEAVPTFDMTIPSGILVGSDTISLPTFACVDGANANVTANTPAGTYPITGTYPTGANPNYKITVTSGTLTVKQDASLPTWFHLEGVTTNTTLDPNRWHNQDVKVVLEPGTESAGTYDEISLDKTLWDPSFISVSNEDENKKDVYFRINASDPTHPLAMSTSQATTIKIDKTKPVIKSITGTTTNKDAVSTLLNKLTFGAYFKPGTKVSMQSEDTLPKPTTKVSGVKEISYSVYEIDKTTGIINTTPKDTGTLLPNASGISEITLNDTGLYRVCAISTDNAGNIGSEKCSDVNIKNVGVDVDKDGTIDNLDPDKDGCPDIDIVLKDKDNKFYKINVDRDKDNLPDLNIDSNGDGEADINIDTDNDGKPDLNLLVITKDMWKPTFCVVGQSEEYCTVKDLKPTINVDLGNDGTPDVDIDVDGDMKADYNITKDGKTPIINIGPVHPWTPNKDYTKDNFSYDTISEDDINPQINVDTDKDGRPDVNLDPTNSGKPTINIDVDGNGIPDVDIDSDGDGIPDINVDEDGNGTADKNIIEIKEWKPDADVDVIKDFPYGTMSGLSAKDTLIDEETGIQIQKPGGAFLPNFAIKVTDVTDKESEAVKDKIKDLMEDQVIKNVLDVHLWKDGSQVQPDGTLRVKVPVNETWKNPSFVIELADGTFKKIEGEIIDGFFVYNTDFLGKLTVLDDDPTPKPEDPTPSPEEPKPTPDPEKPTPEPEEPTPTPTPETPTTTPDSEAPKTSVKGTYISGMGGAMTGDTTSFTILMVSTVSALGLLVFSIRKRYHKE